MKKILSLAKEVDEFRKVTNTLDRNLGFDNMVSVPISVLGKIWRREALIIYLSYKLYQINPQREICL